MTGIHHYCIIQTVFTALKILCALPTPSSPHGTAIAVSSVAGWRIVGMIPHVVLLDWLLSRSDMYLRFLHVFSWLDNSFLLESE